MKIVAEIVTAIILLASVFLMIPNLVSEFRMETFEMVGKGLGSLEKVTQELTKK